MPESSTSFKFGNTAWKARSSHGRNPIFETPEILEKACLEYFQWVQDNPLIAAETVKFQGVGKTMAIPKMRAMTLDGLCTFLDISDETWRNYREKADFIGVIARIERIIRVQKFEGAAADLLNANIIARDLGLADKQKHEHSGAVLTPATKEMTYDEARQLYQENMRADEGGE